jgi:hypothetical protein
MRSPPSRSEMGFSLSTDRILISLPKAPSGSVQCVVSNPKWEVLVMTKFKRLVVFAVAALSLATAVTPAYAGEDGDDEPQRRHRASGGGGSDTGSASGGAQTGFGGIAVDKQDSTTTVVGLAGGGLLVLTAAGLVARRREIEVGA